MRSTTAALIVLSLALGSLAFSAEPKVHRVVVDDFEHGISHWQLADDHALPGKGAKKLAIYDMSDGATDESAHSMRVEFKAAASGWASAAIPVDGQKWAEQGCGKLTLWLRGDGSDEKVRLSLGVHRGDPPREFLYTQLIKLDSTDWQKYSFRFFGFAGPGGAGLKGSDVADINLLQFSKSGAWDHFRFRVDDIVAESEPIEEAPAVHKPSKPEPPAAGKIIRINADFNHPASPLLAQIGIGLGPGPTILDSKERDTASWANALVSDLGPCSVRLLLNDYFNPRTETYDLDLLDRHMKWVESCDCRPLICLDVPRAEGDSAARKERLFGVFVKAVSDLATAHAKSGADRYYELFDEPIASGLFPDVQRLVAAYNKLSELIAATDAKAKIGGPGFASAWDDRLEGFLKGAGRLDFLSFHFFGTRSELAESTAVFESATKTRDGALPHQLSFQQVRRLTRTLRKDQPEIFVTEFGLSSARDDRGNCRDERATTGFGAAWLATTFLAGATQVDKLGFHKLAPGGWGMISASGVPEPPYWAAWMLRNYAPRGSQILQVSDPADFTVAATIKTRTAYNLIIAYAGAQPADFRISAESLPPLGQVRDRRIGDSDHQWKGEVLETAPDQRVVMEQPGVLVIQYIPKK